MNAPITDPGQLERMFPGDSEMARRMRELDWTHTAVGPVSEWPESLGAAVRLMLNSRYPMFIWWGASTLTYFYNDAYSSVLGEKHPRALGRSGQQVWPEIWGTLSPFVRLVFDEKRGSWSEDLLLMVERSGYREQTYFTFSYSPIFDADGSVGGLFCACMEETKRVVAERRLRVPRAVAAGVAAARSIEEACAKAAERLDEDRTDLPFTLLYLLDDDGQTARLAACSGVDDPDRGDIAISNAQHPWKLASVLRSGAGAVVSGIEKAFPNEVPSGPGGERPSQAIVVPLRRPAHSVLAGFAVFGLNPHRPFDDDYRGFCELVASHIATGIANARAYDEEHRRATALAELDRAKTDFFSNVSHEFRTPLTLMLGPLEDVLAGRADASDPSVRRLVEIAHRGSLRLLKLVNTLLDFSRIEAGRIEASYEETDLCTLTDGLASAFRTTIERAGLGFAVTCESDEATAWVDREMWEKIVLNLLSNAFKFTLTGSIEVRVRDDGRHVTTVVSDTGIGIPPEELPHVFERFHRVRGAKGRTHEGSGIGLALVQELVRLHGGTIEVSSREGAGTSVCVRIPKGFAHLPADRIGGSRTLESTSTGAGPYVAEALRWLPDGIDDAVPPMKGDGGASVATAGARILVVDDNRDLREYLRRLLGGHWQTETASNGEEALIAIRRSPPDLVLCDVMMPNLDGFGLLDAVRRDPQTRTLPVILLSARSGEEARVEGLRAGADDYLTKPFSARELIARIDANLALDRLRRESQKQIGASEARYRSLVEATASIVWRAAPDGAVLEAPGWSEFTGQSEDELKGWGWAESVHHDDLASTLQTWREARAASSPARAEFRLRAADGSYRWVAVRAVPVMDSPGDVVEWIGTVVDIHDERVATADLIESRLELSQELAAAEQMQVVSTTVVQADDEHTVFERILDAAVAIMRADFASIQRLNPAAEGEAGKLELVGFRGFDAASAGFWKWADPTSSSTCAEALRTRRRVVVSDVETHPGCVGSTDLAHYFTNGIRAVQTTPLVSRTGTLVGMVSTHWREPRTPSARALGRLDVLARLAADYIESRRAVEALERARGEAERANKAKDEFLAVLSHELRSPMNAMLGWLRILKTAGTQDSDLISKAADTIERNIHVQAQVINDLLDVSRIMSGKLQLDQERVDVGAVVTGCVESLRPSAEAKQVALRLSVQQEIDVIGDAARLEQIVANLVGNAIKFTPGGGFIHVVVEGTGDSARIEVSDSGQGIAPEFLPHLFERFRQADSSTARRHGGLGLGLAIAKNLVELHGGAIEAKSNGPGQGSHLTVTIPRAEKRTTIPMRPVHASAVQRIADSLAALDVLLVEDDADSRRALELALLAKGAHVRTAASVRQALEAYTARRPDVLISDIGMPDEDGYALIRAIREREEGRSDRTLAIAVTGFAGRQDREAALRAGFDEHIAKPVEPDSLFDRVRALESSRN